MILLLALWLDVSFAQSRFPVVGCEGPLAEEFSRRPQPAFGFSGARFRRTNTITQGPRITLSSIRAAYQNGIFPWGTVPGTNRGIWSNPAERGVLKFCDLHVPRRDLRYIKRALTSGEFIFTENVEPRKILEACARNFHDTWLTPKVIDAYLKAFEAGLLVVDGAWINVGKNQRGPLVAAMYGVDYKNNYSGESMVHTHPNVLKVLLYRRIQDLIARGREFMDVQEALLPPPNSQQPSATANPTFRTSLAVKWGARPIPRKQFLRMMRAAQAREDLVPPAGLR